MNENEKKLEMHVIYGRLSWRNAEAAAIVNIVQNVGCRNRVLKFGWSLRLCSQGCGCLFFGRQASLGQ